MTISKRLYLNFGLILGILIALFIVNTIAVRREHSAKAEATHSLELARSMEAVRFQMMQNRMALQNYLLSGDTREVDRMREGNARLAELLKKAQDSALSDGQRTTLTRVETLEREWVTSFANKMVEKRKEVDSGNATVADLQVSYLTLDPQSWVSRSTEPLDDAQAETTRLLEERQKSDDSATMWTTLLSVLATLVALGLGVAIAWRTSQSPGGPRNRSLSLSHTSSPLRVKSAIPAT